MKTLLVGAGAIGGTIAVYTKKAGYDVRILCHSESTKNKIESEGFKIKGALGENVEKFTCYCSPEEIGDEKFDIVIIATKYSAMADAAKMILPLINEDSVVVGMQNGICTAELAEIVGAKRAVGCMLGFGATRISANEVDMTSKGEMVIGMPNGYTCDNLEKLNEMLGKVLPTKISSDIRREQYSKLIINSCINATAALTGKTLGVVIDDRRARNLFMGIAREGMRVAEGMGMDVPTYPPALNYKLMMKADNKVWNTGVRYIIWLVSKMYGNVKPSTLQSLERGELTEIDIFNGYFARKGAEYGVKTPINSLITKMIHEIEEGKRKIGMENLDEFKGLI